MMPLALAVLSAVLIPAAGAGETPAPAADAAAGATEPMKLERLSWLAGCWGDTSEGVHIEEHWMAPQAGTMLGMSRTTREGKTIAFEYMRIAEKAGRLVFTAKPSGQPEASFTAIELGDDRVTFANPKHDFPQRIVYRRANAGRLTARIEGSEAGKPKGFDFPMAATECPRAR